tara:strand:- start:618 stop:989 length:372 start_codon:yes stop_codon:yes gene_type:complete
MSVVKTNDLQSTTGAIPTVKGQRLIPTAWVNFNGTGTVAIRDSENVSSITDNGVGIYRVNFSSLLSSINFCPLAGCEESAGGWNRSATCTPTTTTYTDVRTFNTGTNLLFDAVNVYVQVMGGQ